MREWQTKPPMSASLCRYHIIIVLRVTIIGVIHYMKCGLSLKNVNQFLMCLPRHTAP